MAKPKKWGDIYIDALNPGEDRYWDPDPLLPGHGVRVTPNGVKTFYARTRDPNGTLVWQKIGSRPLFSAEESREIARTVLKAIKAGTDRARPGTFLEVSNDWYKRHVEAKKLLTARDIYRDRPLTRVVFDRQLRTPADAKLFTTLSAGPVVVVTCGTPVGDATDRMARLLDVGATVVAAPEATLTSALECLPALDVHSVEIEGGAEVHAAAWDEGVVDAVQIYVAPVWLGATGVPLFAGRGPELHVIPSAPLLIDRVVIAEDITQGERVRRYVVEGSVDGAWKELAAGTAIGHKKIDRFAPARVEEVRLRVLDSVGEPVMRQLAIFRADAALMP